MIKTFTLQKFCTLYPCFKETFAHMLHDKNYIVKVDMDGDLIGGIEVGYPTDKWFLS